MPIVVSDTSPIRAFHFLKLLHLLEKLYRDVYLPQAVADELRHPAGQFTPIEPADFPFLHIEEPVDRARVAELERLLDAGEAAAMVLAIEKHADFILIDEREGRRVAADLGVPVAGVIAVLLKAKAEGFIPLVVPLIDQLRTRLNFRLSQALVDATLRFANE